MWSWEVINTTYPNYPTFSLENDVTVLSYGIHLNEDWSQNKFLGYLDTVPHTYTKTELFSYSGQV